MKNVLKTLSKSVFIPLVLTAAFLDWAYVFQSDQSKLY